MERLDEAEISLQEELRSFQQEQESIDEVLGTLGGVQSRKKERWINISILFIAVSVFVIDVVFELFDPIYAVEFGVLLVSIKIIMLIHSLSKMSHFNFWILRSIEQRLNDVSQRIKSVEKEVKEQAVKEQAVKSSNKESS